MNLLEIVDRILNQSDADSEPLEGDHLLGLPSKLTGIELEPFRDRLEKHRKILQKTLGRNINHNEVADTALFLLSEMASGITGAIIPVDAGYSIVAL